MLFDMIISYADDYEILKIYSNIDDKMLFSGWMLKSLPSISSLEHPLYDIWVKDCA